MATSVAVAAVIVTVSAVVTPLVVAPVAVASIAGLPAMMIPVLGSAAVARLAVALLFALVLSFTVSLLGMPGLLAVLDEVRVQGVGNSLARLLFVGLEALEEVLELTSVPDLVIPRRAFQDSGKARW